MASSGQRNKQTVRGTDGNDFAYRQTIDTKYNSASSSKQTLVNLTVMGTVIACFVGVIAMAQAYRVFIISVLPNTVTYLSTNIGILRFEFDPLLADLGYACLILLTSFIGWSSVSRVVTAGISAASSRLSFMTFFLWIIAAITSFALYLAYNEAVSPLELRFIVLAIVQVWVLLCLRTSWSLQSSWKDMKKTVK